MIGTQIRKMLRSAFGVLPVAARSRLIGLRRSMRSPQQGREGAGAEAERFRAGLPSLQGFLQHIQGNGFSPYAILDIGANAGEWSRVAASVFLSARILMFDGDSENEPALHNTVREIGSRAEYFLGLLGATKNSAVTLYRPEAGTTGSSVLPELTSFSKQAVTLPMDTLDSLMDGATLQSPLLIKLDVQGFELEVLRGGRRTVGLAEVVILEASLLPYNEGAPLFADVVAFMQEEGFLVFDFCGQNRRESDHALFQTDIAFVRRASELRAPRRFWLREP